MCEQDYENKKLMITKFSFILQSAKLKFSSYCEQGLSIFELLVKYIWQYYCQCRISLEFGKNIDSSIILHN